MRVLLDVNVILDVLAAREPHLRDSAAVLSLVEAGTVDGSLAAHTLTTLHYLLSRELTEDRTNRVLTDLLQIVDVVAVDGALVDQALAMGWEDFEDAVQAACAERAGADYIVTRNQDDFRSSAVKAISPAAFRALYT